MPGIRTETRTTYGFRDASTGALVRISTSSNGPHPYACGENRYALSDNGNDPVFEIADPRQAAIILATDVPWYNSDAESPSWGDFKGKGPLLPVRFEVVERFDERYRDPVETTRSTAEAVLPRTILVDKLSSSRRAVTVLSRRYFGSLPPEGTDNVEMAAFSVPSDLSLEDLAGAVLMREGERMSVGTVLDSAAVPEDYPVSGRDPLDLPSDRQAVLVLFDAWHSRPDPVDYATWERVQAPDAASSPRP